MEIKEEPSNVHTVYNKQVKSPVAERAYKALEEILAEIRGAHFPKTVNLPPPNWFLSGLIIIELQERGLTIKELEK